jgi:hypothetical protein
VVNTAEVSGSMTGRNRALPAKNQQAASHAFMVAQNDKAYSLACDMNSVDLFGNIQQNANSRQGEEKGGSAGRDEREWDSLCG